MTPGQTFIQVLRFSSDIVIPPVFIIHSVTYLFSYSSTMDLCDLPVDRRSVWEATPWSRVLLEKLIVPQLVKKFSSYGIRSLISGFTEARHLPLSWARIIHSTAYKPSFLKTPFNIRQSGTVLPSGLCTSGFPCDTLYASPLPPCVPHASSI
jgi:hypothetical protein